MKPIIKYTIWFFSLGIIFFLFNILSSLLPNAPIKKQLNQNIDYYNTWGDYGRPIMNDNAYTFDYFTDAIIMNIAASTNNHRPIYSALSCTYHEKFDIYDNSRWVYLKHVTSSEKYPEENIVAYPRYWFGASFFYRLFFLFADYASLRIFLYLVSSILLFTFLIRQYHRSNWSVALTFLLGLLFVNLMFMQYLIQFSSVLIISLSIAIAVQGRYNKTNKDIGILFFLSGALTVYFDLLTAPILSLGFPLLVWVQLYLSKNTNNTKQALYKIITFSFLWSIAYFGLFFYKWALVGIFTNIDILSDVKSQAMHRTGISSDVNKWQALTKNINAINLVILSSTILLSMIYSAFKFNISKAKHAYLYLLVGLIPFVWMLVINEHSASHYWYTYRILAISISSIFLTILSFRKQYNVPPSPHNNS